MPKFFQEECRNTLYRSTFIGPIFSVTQQNEHGMNTTSVIFHSLPPKDDIIMPCPTYYAANRQEAMWFMWYERTKVWLKGKNFVVSTKVHPGRMMFRATWALLFCLFTLPAFSQFPPLAGEAQGIQYTLDQDLLCLYQIESGKELGLMLHPNESLWDSNGFTVVSTPRFDPTQEPAYLIRWFTSYIGVDAITGRTFEITLFFEWWAGKRPIVSRIEIIGDNGH